MEEDNKNSPQVVILEQQLPSESKAVEVGEVKKV
jgi:hypothetical protein